MPIRTALWKVAPNQNTVCKPTTPEWRTTVERLKQRFKGFDRQ